MWRRQRLLAGGHGHCQDSLRDEQAAQKAGAELFGGVHVQV